MGYGFMGGNLIRLCVSELQSGMQIPLGGFCTRFFSLFLFLVLFFNLFYYFLPPFNGASLNKLLV